jgi:GDP-4-dehydro-6-deoxy-D-mannose reductase
VASPARGAKTALVTGAAGFAGQWLCRDLVHHGWSVIGTSLEGDPGPGILGAGDHRVVTWLRQDLRGAEAIAQTVEAIAPDVIFHLAGVSFVPAAGRDPVQAFDVNAGVAVRLLHAVGARRAAGTLDPVVVLIGSGEQYGRQDPSAIPLDEQMECRPCSVYAATKTAQEVFGLQAFRSEGTRVVCTRSFNHSGRGQAGQFLLPALVARALRARTERTRTLDIGNTDTVRDFLHVEDAVRAYVMLAERGHAGEVYNVCSGQGISVGDLALAVLTAAGADARPTPVEELRRRSDVPTLVGRNDKLRVHTGWAPRRSRDDIIADLIDAATH